MTAIDVYHAFDVLSRARARLRARDEDVVAEQITIAEIPAPTGEESRRAGWMASRLMTRGREVAIDRAGNVIARHPGLERGEPVVVCAHLDTVFARDTALGVCRRRGRLCGPGISDNARGLAAMLAIADAFAVLPLRTRRPILFAATTGEEGEGDLRGARHLFATAARDASAAIAIDGAGDERVVNAALGCRRYRISYRGGGGHSWAAWGTPNAVHAVGGLIARLAARVLPQTPRTTLTVSRIGGGTTVNSIPRDAWADVDIRSVAAGELAKLDHELRAAAVAALEEENARRTTSAAPLSVEVAITGDRPPGEVSPDTPLVRAALEATALVRRSPELGVASTDANIPIALGIPSVAIGAGGRAGDTHTPDEWYENTEGYTGIERALTLIAAVAGIA